MNHDHFSNLLFPCPKEAREISVKQELVFVKHYAPNTAWL